MKTKIVSLIVVCSFLFTNLSFGQLFGPSFNACVLQAPEKKLEGVRKIAISNFANRSNILIRELGAELGDRLPNYMTAALLEEYRGANEKKIYMTKVPTNVFSVIERNEIEKILTEQGFSVSGAVDESNAVEIGQLLGVDALIFGEFFYNNKEESYTTDHKKKDGTIVTTYWRKREVDVNATMKIVSVKSGEILGIKSVKTTERDSKSSKSGYPDLSALQKAPTLADKGFKQLSKTLVNFFSPYYATTGFSLKKVKMKEFKSKAKEATKYLKAGEIKRGYALYKEIYENDSYNPIAAYNLGAIHESVGNFMKAKSLYEIAFQLDEDTKDYRKAYEKTQRYEEMIEGFEALGIEVTPYNFDSEGTVVKSNQVEIKGSKSERIAIYKSPDKGSDVVVKVPGGIDLEIIETLKDWYKVKLLGNKEGYLPASDGRNK